MQIDRIIEHMPPWHEAQGCEWGCREDTALLRAVGLNGFFALSWLVEISRCLVQLPEEIRSREESELMPILLECLHA
jgi:hypothetical protein